MKKICVLLVLLLASTAVFAQEYVAIDTYNGTHVIIDNRVNVRDAPSLSGTKLFQVSAGDEVTILEYCYDVPWMYAEGYYAPWIKIRYGTLEGYICGRYVSTKEAYGDIDLDGQQETIACLTVSYYKDRPVREYMSSYDCFDVNHVIIRHYGDFEPITLSYTPDDELNADTSYDIRVVDELDPPVAFLVARKGFGDGGGGWTENRFYYYKDSDMDLFTKTSSSSYECEFDEYEEMKFYTDQVIIFYHKIYYDDEIPAESGRRVYSWKNNQFTSMD